MTSTFTVLPRTAVSAPAALAIVRPLTSTIGLEPTPGR